MWSSCPAPPEGAYCVSPLIPVQYNIITVFCMALKRVCVCVLHTGCEGSARGKAAWRAASNCSMATHSSHSRSQPEQAPIKQRMRAGVVASLLVQPQALVTLARPALVQRTLRHKVEWPNKSSDGKGGLATGTQSSGATTRRTHTYARLPTRGMPPVSCTRHYP